MDSSDSFLFRCAQWLTFASALVILVSIAVSQILLALAVAALLMSGARLRLPPIKLPLALFILGTLVSLAFSGNPSAGLPQIWPLSPLAENPDGVFFRWKSALPK